MTFKQLDYFLAIARHGNITAAAKELNLSQPPLSTQLRLLEEELGITLFRRDKNRLLITPAGRMLRNKATQILALTDSTVRAVQILGDTMRGTIHIGAVTSVCYRILPEKAKLFLQECPNVEFQLWEGSTMRIIELLTNGVIEIGIVREPYDHGLFQNYPCWDSALDAAKGDPFVAVGLPQYLEAFEEGRELALSELEGIPFIVHRRFKRLLLSECKKLRFQPNILCQNDDLISSLSWAANGLGVALVPLTSSTLQIGETPMLVRRIILSADEVDTKIALIARKGDRLPPATEAFLELLSRQPDSATAR